MVRPSPSLCGVRGCIGGWTRKAHVPIEKTAVNPTDHQLAHPQVGSLCSLRKSQQEVPFFSSQMLLIDISISIERFLYWKPDMRNPYPLLWYRQLELDNLSTVRSMLWWILSESHKRKTSQSVGRGVPERGPWQVWGGKEALRVGWHCIWFNWEKVPNEQNATPWCCNYHYCFLIDQHQHQSHHDKHQLRLIFNTITIVIVHYEALLLRFRVHIWEPIFAYLFDLLGSTWINHKELSVAVAERSSSSWKPSVSDGSSECLG